MAQYPLYSVEGLHLELYDASLAKPPAPIDGDVDFYLRLSEQYGGHVLELGCGTGRVAWQLAAAGYDVVGLELSEAMRSRAEAKRAVHANEVGKRVQFVGGDMTDFKLTQRFGLIIAPFRAFQHILRPDDQRRALHCIRRHVLPTGAAVLHLFDPRLDFLVPGSPGPREPLELRHPTSGRRIRREVAERRLDEMHQIVEELWRETEFTPSGDPTRVEENWLALRWTYRWEMRYLLELCGFAVEAEYSDFRGSAPAYGREQIWVARPL